MDVLPSTQVKRYYFDLCSICSEPWTLDKTHQMSCLPCGHIFGMSCIKVWMEDRSSDRCLECSHNFSLESVRLLYETRLCIPAAADKKMTLPIVKRVASNLMRVRVMTSSSRFYNTRCFQYDKRDSEDVCILNCDSKPGSMVHHAVNHAFNPHVSPTENLLWILNYVDGINGVKYGMHKVPWWNVEEDDKSLTLLRAMPTQSKEYPSGVHVTESEESVLHEEYKFAIHPNDEKHDEKHREMNISSLLHAMRQHEMGQIKSESSDYYFHVMHDFRELPRLAIPASGTTRAVSFPFHVSYKLQNPQAIRIILGLGGRDAAGQETADPFQGYAFEIFLPERLFNVQDAKQHKTSGLWKIRIPKKKGECVQTVGGNLLLFYTKDICKPSLWRPTMDHVSVTTD